MTSSWETYTTDEATKFEGTAMEKRALKRTVRAIKGEPGKWLVEGVDALNDAYPSYSVVFNENRELRYECSCFSHGQGDSRRRRLCSHVIAVVLHRRNHPDQVAAKKNPLTQMWEGEPVEVEATGVSWDEMPRGSAARRGEAAGRLDAAGGGEGVVGAVETVGESEAVVEPSYKPVGLLNTESPFKPKYGLDDLPHDPPSPQDPIFGSPPLPAQYTEFRENQWKAILDVVELFEAGMKVVMLSAPTGSGKTLVGEAVRRLLGKRMTYSCTTKSLQDQTVRDFDYAKVMKGRSNYPTYYRKDLTAEDCTGTKDNNYECDWCPTREVCAYQIAKEEATIADLPVLNVAYLLAETSVKANSRFIGRGLAVIDEADTLENQLMTHAELAIGARLRKELGVDSLPKKTVAVDWVRWLREDVLPAIDVRRANLRGKTRAMPGSKPFNDRRVKQLTRLKDKISKLVKGGGALDGLGTILEDEWVMTENKQGRDGVDVVFKPIKVADHAQNVLWNMAQRFLLMSATFVSPTQIATDLGIGHDDWDVVTIDSTFPIENRPVFIDAVVAVTNKTKVTAWPIIAEAVGEIVKENPGVRILVHTVSYHLTNYIYENVKNADGRMLKYGSARDRQDALEKYLDRDDAVLLAPSFDRGIDLPEEHCEVIVIAKLPYPNLGDKQVAARLYSRGGQSWYAVQTIRSIIQMTGRGMRSKDDWCDTYVLDSSFKRLWRDSERLFPKWWKDSLVLSRTNPKYRKMVMAARERKKGRE